MEGFDPEGRRLPVKLDSTSNGEFMPTPLSAEALAANRLAHERATEIAKRLGLSRRGFLKSLSGAAATLIAMNEAFARFDKVGGGYDILREAAFEPAVAEASIGGDEFIFDIQGHHVNPKGAWRGLTNRWTYTLRFFPQADCGDGAIECFSAEHFIREVFLDSDTDMAVLSAVPAAPEDNPLSTGRGGHHPRHGRCDGGRSPLADPRPSPSEPAGRTRGHGEATGRIRYRRMENLHPMGA